MTSVPFGLALVGMLALPALALAQGDKYSVTPEEHAACDADAYRLCNDSKDEDQVLACMRGHRVDLTSACRTTFDAGLKRRRMPL